MRFPLTSFGRREIALYGGGSVLLILGAVVAARAAHMPYLAAVTVLPALLLAFTIQFFRDPERAAPPGTGPEAVLSPADGTVVDIVEVEEPEFLGARALRVGIFMSPFNCHVNRFPVDGVVKKVVHRAGKFLAAYEPRAIAENEASTTGILGRFPGGREAKIMLRQVAGVAARRIVNPLALGAAAVRGERFGMIKFGSRCELFLPVDAGFEVAVKIGDRTYAGTTVLARLAGVPAGGTRGGGCPPANEAPPAPRMEAARS